MHEKIVLCGWGQITQPKHAQPPFLGPVDMMEQAARIAGQQAGTDALSQIDAILVVRSQSRYLAAPADELARRLGARPVMTRVSGIGGESPQHFVNQAAGMLARHEANLVLVCGAEAFYPRAAGDPTGEGALVRGIPADYAEDDLVGSNPWEQRHGLTLPIHGFPLFENALWAASGKSREDWLESVGQMWADFSEVAARHPNAWTRAPRTAMEIVTPGPDNRPIAFPYTKRMVSLVTADLGAAILMSTARYAAKLQGGAGKVAYFLGGGYARDRQRFLIEKSAYTKSPALAAAARKAQNRAEVPISEVEAFDLYSCFPCAVTIARHELGIAENDRRPLTQTGGLGFFGGPGSNFALHGIATMAENIAAGRYRSGLTTAIGWFMHKYAVGLYGAQPNTANFEFPDREDDAQPLAGAAPMPCAEAAQGEGVIDTYTVLYARDHTPVRSILYGRLLDGRRFVANGLADTETFTRLTGENAVGLRVQVSFDPASGCNRGALQALAVGQGAR